MELLATKKQIEEQEREITLQTASVATGPTAPAMPEALANPLPLASTNLGPSRSFINTGSANSYLQQVINALQTECYIRRYIKDTPKKWIKRKRRVKRSLL